MKKIVIVDRIHTKCEELKDERARKEGAPAIMVQPRDSAGSRDLTDSANECEFVVGVG